MVIFGFMLNYALRVNLTIAIVAMVDPLMSGHGHSSTNGLSTNGHPIKNVSAPIEANYTVSISVNIQRKKIEYLFMISDS